MSQQPSPVALGIYTLNSAAGNWRDDSASGQKALVGITPGIIHRFQPWTGAAWADWDQAWMDDAANLGCMPMISWEGRDLANPTTAQPTYSNAAILSGNWDWLLVHFLEQAGAWGKPFLLRLFWEGNGQWFPWAAGTNGNSPRSYVNAWQHVAELVRQYAPLARLVWCVGSSGSGWLPMAEVYPGDDWVDYLAVDFYNTGSLPGGWSGGWQPFGAVQPWYDQLAAIADQPVLITEFGSVTEPGQDKAAWYAAIPTACAAMPRLRGIVAFDQMHGSLDFRVSADPAVRAAWAALAHDPRMQGRL